MDKEIEEAIEQLESLKLDRESFLQNDKEHDEIYLKDIKAIETILKLLEQQDKTIKGNECAIEIMAHNEEVLLEVIEKKDKRINELKEVAEYWRKEFERMLTKSNLID